MKTAGYGRILFGASAVLFGAIALMWHDKYTWQELSRILAMPAGAIVGNVLMVAQIAGGIGILFGRTLRPASAVLVVVYALFCAACIPGIVAAPRVYGEYAGFFEQFALLCGAVAVYALSASNVALSVVLGRAARIGLGLCAVSFTLAQAIYLRDTAGLVPSWIPPNQNFWAIFTTVAFALAAFAILINVKARLALALMTVMIALFGAIVWIPQLAAHTGMHFAWSEFALTVLIAGASWAVADITS